VQIQQDRDLVAARAAHPAFGAHAPGTRTARAGRQRSIDQPRLLLAGARLLLGRVIRHEREVELGVGPRGQFGQRREVALVALVLRHGERHEAHRPRGGRGDRVQHPDLQRQ
jgi:hypothetical protein